jgi:hypothetical protein
MFREALHKNRREVTLASTLWQHALKNPILLSFRYSE